MTTLAIIGGGIAGRSLLYALAKRKKNFSGITLFDSDSFAHTCSLRSTAIVAARGVVAGHSQLGDLLAAAFETFSAHVQKDSPQGIFPITQYTGAITKLDQFKKRYPVYSVEKKFSAFSLAEELHMATESAYLIDTKIYLQWLLDESQELPLTTKNDFVVEVNESSNRVDLKTHNRELYSFDKVIFAGGCYNRYWGLPKAGKSVQGSYLEFSGIDLGPDSFSLTLEGDNFVYHAHTHILLIGSTTNELSHEIPFQMKLAEVYSRLGERLEVRMPDLGTAKIITGIREKAQKRSPYVEVRGKIASIGGFYKNGYSLGLHLGHSLLESL